MFEGPEQQAIAARVSSGLEAAYARAVGKTLNTYPSETVTAILYTRDQFRDITQVAVMGGRAPTTVGSGSPCSARSSSPAELDRIVTHEFVHARDPADIPAHPRLAERGLATYLEPGDHAWLTARLRAGGR